MTDRSDLLREFLRKPAWSEATILPLAGDASNRRYLRLASADGRSAVVMDAAPERGEDVRPFLRIARYLKSLGFSAPEILDEDPERGFLILEDLGDDLFNRVLRADPGMEMTLYEAATDLLSQLHGHAAPPGLSVYGPEIMADMAALALDWYRSGGTDGQDAPRQIFVDEMRSLLAHHLDRFDVLVQRDYHADNLIWLPEREGLARVGLLDFQDAMLGHRAYDLVSVLQDARRDVSLPVENAMIERYIRFTGSDPGAFRTAYRCLGAQRNLRILGVFARLCLRDGKAHYIDLIPRVWSHLQRDLEHPALSGIAPLIRAALPEPSPSQLQGLKEKCATTALSR